MCVLDRYQIEPLIAQCAHILLLSMTIDNTLTRYVLADQCRCIHLKNACLALITLDSTQLEKVKQQPAFGALSKAQLMTIIECMTPSGREKRKHVTLEDDDEDTAAVALAAVNDKKKKKKKHNNKSNETGSLDDNDEKNHAALHRSLTKTEIERLRVRQLRHELDVRGLSTSGLRSVLVDRLVAFVEEA